MRRLPALETLFLVGNPFGDEGLAALVAPPPPAGAPPPTTGGLTKLKVLEFSGTQITDAGCATLTAALGSGTLPALQKLYLDSIPASAAATAAVYEARPSLNEVGVGVVLSESESESEHEESGSEEESEEESEEWESEGEDEAGEEDGEGL